MNAMNMIKLSTFVDLAADCSRRDLTINAMAFNESGELVDPLNGYEDLKNKILRHAGSAFVDDPLRIVRLARLAARYSDFSIHPETFAMAKKVVSAGDLNHLSMERFWAETQKAFEDGNIDMFFANLRKFGAFEHVTFFKDLFAETSDELFERANAFWFPRSTKVKFDPQEQFDLFLASVGNANQLKQYRRSYSADIANWVNRAAQAKTSAEFVQVFNKARLSSLPDRVENIQDVIYVLYGPAACGIFCARCNAANKVDAADVMANGFVGKAIADEVTRRRIMNVDFVNKHFCA